jgi:hypothetical protein
MMKAFFEQAITNVIRHGDTDIFPFPIENHLFFDKRAEVVALLQDIHANFEDSLSKYPPANEGALAPVSYAGFRWATQLDPLWNLYFLSLVLSIAESVEEARLSPQTGRIFSYRYKWNEATADLFDNRYHWGAFMECSLRHAESHKFVVVCDISEFYPRLGHHRLENALLHLSVQSDAHKRIMAFLSNFSNTSSFGLPVGGPAARILSELVLNQIDRLLLTEGLTFCRFADDFHIFCDSTEDAYGSLIFLTEKLFRNQGLQLQKSKTRIMSSAEFAATTPLRIDDHDAPATETRTPALQEQARGLLRLSLRFDPYSATARADYEALKAELEKFDLVGLLREELSKSRIHISLTRKIVNALKYIDPIYKDDAIISLMSNAELLYPIFPAVLTVTKTMFNDLSPDTQEFIHRKVVELIESHSHVLRVELNLAYAIRLLSCYHSLEAEAALAKLYKLPTSSTLLRRDIILAMAKWQNWYWLSDLRTSFRSLSSGERRAFIVASYSLRDEGKHWRQHTSGEFTPFEQLVQAWVSQKVNQTGWSIPL